MQDGFEELPSDVLHRILDLLPRCHIATCSSVCKGWRRIALERPFDLHPAALPPDSAFQTTWNYSQVSFTRILAEHHQYRSDLGRGITRLDVSLPDMEPHVATKHHMLLSELEALEAALPRYGTLTSLHMRNWKLTEATLKVIATALPRLSCLDITGCELASPSRSALQALQHLTTLPLKHLSMGAFRAPIHMILRELVPMPTLESLVLSSSRVHDAKYQSYIGLSKLTQLTCLCLRGARSFGDSDMKVLEGMSKLKQLDLSGTRVSIIGLEGCSQLAVLTSLATGSQHMHGVNAVPRLQFKLLRKLVLDDVDGLSDLWLLLCTRLPNLEVLSVRNSRFITSRGFSLLPSLSQLHSLNVAGCRGFGPPSLRHLVTFSHLTELTLSFDQTDQMRALLQLAHLPLHRLVFKDMESHTNQSMEYHYQSGLQRPKSESMFRPVYASPFRRLTMKEILERLPPHMRLAAANGCVPNH
ncbi:hypothetical protein WJX73_000958 [Symbiochloris irregularis]|uniref:F-box domain-containing protein n=1 Tax=Symbiochloris irregularis TaxID=706552 RepID=A0AAW1PII1_9CHLO